MHLAKQVRLGEIGPAHDRPSAKLYEKWVKSAGGSIRGGKKQNDIAVVGENAKAFASN